MMTDRSASPTPQEIAACLQATLAGLRAELGALPASLTSWHPAPGEWCIKEVLGHMIEAEQRGFAGRIRTILGGADLPLAGWDQVAVAQARRDCARDLAALLDEFGWLREASVGLVAGLQDADLGRGGHHQVIGYVRVDELLVEWLYHDCNHVRQMLANVQGFVWPAMGSTQRFYQ